MSTAAKSGTPSMEGFRPSIPASVPATAANNQLGVNDVSITQPGGDSTAIDKGAEARSNPNGTGPLPRCQSGRRDRARHSRRG